MIKKRIAIIFGGKSSEHEVSLMSAASIIRVIDKNEYEPVYIGITKEGEWRILREINGVSEMLEDGSWLRYAKEFNMSELKDVADFALPIVHGPYCEDGKLQGFFETIDIPYGGCGVLASAIAMDKLAAKDIFSKVGFPICRHRAVFRHKYLKDRNKVEADINESIGYPCFVKPANMGSSVGISKVYNRSEFFAACEKAMRYDKRLIVEEAVNAREIETAILGNENPEASTIGEILPAAEFYTYNDKYIDGASKLMIPAELPPETCEKIKEIAIDAYKAIDGEGFARVDFLVEKETGKIYLNEINTIPGFTKISMFPMLWEAAGLSYAEIIERIIELGYERHNDKNYGQTVF